MAGESDNQRDLLKLGKRDQFDDCRGRTVGRDANGFLGAEGRAKHGVEIEPPVVLCPLWAGPERNHLVAVS